MKILSVNVGLPREVIWKGITVQTALLIRTAGPLSLGGALPRVCSVEAKFGTSATAAKRGPDRSDQPTHRAILTTSYGAEIPPRR
jgi:hypothetical protein